MQEIEQETEITNEERDFIEFMRDDFRTTYDVNGTLVKKLFMEDSGKSKQKELDMVEIEY